MGQSVILTGSYNYHLVVVSFLISILAAYTALELAGRVTATHSFPRFGFGCPGGTCVWHWYLVHALRGNGSLSPPRAGPLRLAYRFHVHGRRGCGLCYCSLCSQP
jgi:hypothetical protein